MNETTERMIRDASEGPGDHVKRFARAKPAQWGRLSKIQKTVFDRYRSGVVFGFTSKAFIYDKGAPRKASEVAAFASLVKGGVLLAFEEVGPPPGRPESSWQPRHYIVKPAAQPASQILSDSFKKAL